MSFALITLSIIDYIPNTINYNNFSFIFQSDRKDFEDEITYQNSNTIEHKTPIKKKDIRYSIKVNKNNNLIGICEFPLSYNNVLNKKEESFEKLLTITMTDNTKRSIFGNNNYNNNVKILVHADIQYSNLKQSHSLPKNEMKKKINSPIYNKKNNVENEKESNKKEKNKKDIKLKKNNIYTNINNNISNKNYSKNSSGSKQIEKEINLSNFNESIPEDDDDSMINEELTKKILPINNNFINFMNNFQKENPLKILNNFNQNNNKNQNLNDFKLYTKEIIQKLFDYQNKYYILLKELLNKNLYLKKELIKTNEKFRNIIKKNNKLNYISENSTVRKEIIVNLHRNENYHIQLILPLKYNELNLYKYLFNDKNNLTNNIKNNNNKNNTNGDYFEENNEENGNYNLILNLCIKLLKNINEIYGKNLNDNILFTENEKNILLKYNILNKENDDDKYKENGKKILYVEIENNNYDEYDKQLENYLEYFYIKHNNLPKIIFKKISTLNYEFGTQKIIIKFEGDDIIRVKYTGGYMLLEKFIELNAPLEEMKSKFNKKNYIKKNSKK